MYKGDEDWLKNKINELPEVKTRLLAWSCYKKKYDDAFNAEPAEHRKEGKARFTANSALRIYVEKVLNINKLK